ncbi:hypothetical protein MYX75_02825 [Acidobacteria bacterium AH-259-A15]|nr:hypothetical protein [Acidobacteria bacterium AH-259-A15]
MSDHRKEALRILRTALRDAFEGNKEARAFLLEDESFMSCCEVAGLDPAQFRSAARLLFTNNQN